MDINSEKKYSPSAWSKRFSDGDKVLLFHKNFVSKESERAQQLIKFQTISYGTQTNENFDIYGIDLPADSPIVVYIHGGYWQDLNKKMSAYCAAPLVSNGVKVIIVEYDLCPTVTLSEQVDQIIKCGEFIVDYATQIKCRQLTFMGHSAGAHLILCMINEMINKLLNSPTQLVRIDGIYLISGIYDLTELQFTSINKENILGIDESNVTQLSPLMFDFKQWFNQRFVVKIYVAEHDSPTFIEQSFKLFHCFQDNGFVSVNISSIANCDHFDIVEKLTEASYEIIQDIVSNK